MDRMKTRANGLYLQTKITSIMTAISFISYYVITIIASKI